MCAAAAMHVSRKRKSRFRPLAWGVALVVAGAQAAYFMSCSYNSSPLVLLPVAPSVTISVSPTSILLGKSATLSWSSSGVLACTASGAWSGSQPSQGSLTVTPSTTGTLLYTLTCSTANGSVAQSATLTVIAAAAHATARSLPPCTTALISACSDGSGGGSAPPLSASAVWDHPAGTSGILSLAVWGGMIYIGGTFTSVAGTTRNRLAAIDASSGALLNWNPDVQLSNSNPTPCSNPGRLAPVAQVCALAVAGGVVLAGGSFTSVGGESHHSLAAIEGSSGAVIPWKLDVAYGAGYLGTINSLVASGGSVYVGGLFNEISGAERLDVAKIDASTGAVEAWSPVVSESPCCRRVNSIALYGNSVHIGGWGFGVTRPLGATETYVGLAALDANSGATLPWSPHLIGGFSDCVPVPATFNAIVRAGPAVFVAGDFRPGTATCSGNYAAPGLGAISNGTSELLPWNLQTVGATGAGCGYSTSFAAVENSVYVGGCFASVGGVSRNNLAAIDATTGVILPWNPNANGQVTALVVEGGVVYVAGDFTSIGGTTRHSLAKIDPTTGMVVE